MFVLYLTTYSGNRLPPFYVGSTSSSKIARGYHGSVSSEKRRQMASALGKKNGSINGKLPCPEYLKQILSVLKKNVPLTSQHAQNISKGVKDALARPEIHAKLGQHLKGKRISTEALANRCQPCTIDGITIYESRKALIAVLGSGKSGWRHPDFRYLEK